MWTVTIFLISMTFARLSHGTTTDVHENELVLNQENSKAEGKSERVSSTHKIQTEQRCRTISAMKENLFSSESVTVMLQEFLRSTKSKVDELETTCDGGDIETDKDSSQLCQESIVGRSCNTPIASSCYELRETLGFKSSGMYRIWVKVLKRAVTVYCDMGLTASSGGWIVIQRRTDLDGPQEDFYRNWHDYKTGFGNLNGEFWLGNDVISALTNEGSTELLVELEDFKGVKRFARYNTFYLSPEANQYQLKVGGYSGDTGDSLSYHDGKFFITFDKTEGENCANQFKGGWWYGACHEANLNGLYLRGNHTSYADGIEWKSLGGYHYSFKHVEMKIRKLKN